VCGGGGFGVCTHLSVSHSLYPVPSFNAHPPPPHGAARSLAQHRARSRSGHTRHRPMRGTALPARVKAISTILWLVLCPTSPLHCTAQSAMTCRRTVFAIHYTFSVQYYNVNTSILYNITADSNYSILNELQYTDIANQALSVHRYSAGAPSVCSSQSSD